MATESVGSGIGAFDEVVQGLRLGDNVVWQVDEVADYAYFVAPFAERAVAEARDLVYVRFAPHRRILEPRPGLRVVEVDPGGGFDLFCARVHRVIGERGRGAFYAFDCLSSLAAEWATDEQVANFFQVTCPYLFELDTVAYFALLRGQHKHGVIARIRDTTQLLVDVYRARGEMYVHPLKVWQRYSPRMFLPHLVAEGRWAAVSHSGEAAAVSASGRRHPLHASAGSIAPWDSVYRKLREHRQSAGESMEDAPEIRALKDELSRMMLGGHPAFDAIVRRYLTVDDLLSIRERVVGSGRIGGKAAGMLLARSILLREEGAVDFSQVLEAHDSFYVGSDVFFTFLINNDLFRLRLELSGQAHVSWEAFEDVERRFLAGRFPSEIAEQFRDMLDHFGQAPIIARSSSFLEDSFGNAFAGKYRSEFCPNQGGPEERLAAFLRAVKLVYASALNPDALSYRRNRGLAEADEQMAILVQRVSGMPHKHYFFPSLAGVAFSRNLYAWSDRIDARQGMIRLVFGLGTRAVDRVGGDYPRMIAVSHPELRPEVGERVARYSQRLVDLLDLRTNAFTTEAVADVLADGDYPNLHFLVSVMAPGGPRDPATRMVNASADHLVLTFNKLVARTAFVRILGEMLARLERAYGHPVDTEFTASVDRDGRVRVNLLQCRPMGLPGAAAPVAVPEDVPAERTVFRSSRLVGGGVARDLRYILYIDPRRYAAADLATKKSLGRLVGRLNGHPRIAEAKALMMGPGRWGSSNIQLGVNVSYAEIDNAAALVEIAYEEGGHVPEVSYGTHFFQDLVEAGTLYVAVHPGDRAATLNTRLLDDAPSILSDLLPAAEPFADLVRVIDVPAAAHGAHAHVVADPQNRRAICYLE